METPVNPRDPWHDATPTPRWMAWIDRHPLIVAVASVALGAVPFFWS
jgi:hypothetical protein